ncbi:MAG TPA: HAD hydrolase-like protein, partial [Anaerolineaceae bacterium]|nr:HAD hydrolase-like protein [Anaerolineaceae bacterium]
WKVPILAAEIQELMQENIAQIHLFEGVDDLLRELSRQGVKIAVVSSNALKNVKEVLGEELAGLVSFFECGVSMFGKAEKLTRVVKASGLASAQALSIGDEIRDIEAARKAGIPCAAVSWGFSSRTVLESLQPDHLFDIIEQIHKVFEPERK